MDGYSAATSWVLFGTIVGVGVWYYYPGQQRRPSKSTETPQPNVIGRKKRNEQDDRAKQHEVPTSGPSSASEVRSTAAQSANRASSNDNLKKRKAQSQQPRSTPTYAQVVQAEEPEEDAASTKKWAEGMLQAQKGHDIASNKTKETRVRTVKQSSAQHAPALSSGSSQGGGEADDEAVSPALNGADVSDMLEPPAPGPSTLRLTAPTKPLKEKNTKRQKEEVVETKKQRQNRMRVEERRLQREAEEQERKKLEESQRRSAREARGEPAKNGIPVAKPPAVSAWTNPPKGAPGVSSANDSQQAPLLDTFDAESMSSSNGGPDASTGPTSTTSGGAAQWDQDLPSEEDQMAYAMKQSEDESGWTTVSQPKKQKKKNEGLHTEPVQAAETNLATTKAATNGKPRGFQALDVQYEQRTDADPNEASNWNA